MSYVMMASEDVKKLAKKAFSKLWEFREILKSNRFKQIKDDYNSIWYRKLFRCFITDESLHKLLSCTYKKDGLDFKTAVMIGRYHALNEYDNEAETIANQLLELANSGEENVYVSGSDLLKLRRWVPRGSHED